MLTKGNNYCFRLQNMETPITHPYSYWQRNEMLHFLVMSSIFVSFSYNNYNQTMDTAKGL